MERTKEQIKNELLEFKCPRWKDLPDFDIYMDQVIFYITQNLSCLYFDEKEKIITNSMVNNYVKNSIVKPPIKKHYKRYHMAFLIVVCVLKRVYSLSEISQMIEIQKDMKHSNLEEAYDNFSIYFEKYLHEVIEKGNVNSILDKDPNPYQQLLMNVIQSVVLKIYAQVELIDNNFDSTKM